MTEHAKYEWYGVLNGARIGPMTWETLRGRVRMGQLRSNDLVWAAPFGETWQPAGTIEGLFEAAPPPPPLTPPPPPPTPTPASSPPPSPTADSARGDDGVNASGEPPSARRAFRRIWRSMMRTLFEPFDIARWFSIGFCAWVALIGGSGPNIQGMVDPEKLKVALQGGPQTTNAVFSEVFDTLVAIPLFTIAMLSAVVMGLALSVIFCWLRARGTFMFLHRLQSPDASIKEAWRVAGETVLPLFWWRIALSVLGWTALLAILTGAAFSLGIGLLRSGNWGGLVAAVTLPWAAIWGGALTTLLCLWSAVSSLSFHFMEPLLYAHKDGIGKAWLRVWVVCRDYPFAVFRFYLLLSVVLLVAGLAMIVFLLGSCCLGVVLMIIPVVNAVVLLPILWVRRGLGVAFLRQIRIP